MTDRACWSRRALCSDGATIELDDAELHHLRVRRTRRRRRGDRARRCGTVGRTASMSQSGRGTGVAVGAVHRAPRTGDDVLAVGAGDKDRFLLLAERCTELGVTRSCRSRPSGRAPWTRRVRDGVVERRATPGPRGVQAERQPLGDCRRGQLRHWRTFRIRHPAVRWLLGRCTLAAAARASPLSDAVGWIIGPEGGLTPASWSIVAVALAAESVGSRSGDTAVRHGRDGGGGDHAGSSSRRMKE